MEITDANVKLVLKQFARPMTISDIVAALDNEQNIKNDLLVSSVCKYDSEIETTYVRLGDRIVRQLKYHVDTYR